jgi:argininosuccinate lyase
MAEEKDLEQVAIDLSEALRIERVRTQQLWEKLDTSASRLDDLEGVPARLQLAEKERDAAVEQMRQMATQLREAVAQRVKREKFIEALHAAGRISDDELAETREAIE